MARRALALMVVALTLASCGGSTTATSSTLAPISGFGDFSSVRYAEVDWEAVTSALVACMNTQGWVLELDGPTAIRMPDIPSEQAERMEADFDACTVGPRIPPPELPNEAEIGRIYDDLLLTKACLETLGYSIEEPPTRETFTDQYATGPWHPYLSLPPSLSPGELKAVEAKCPQP